MSFIALSLFAPVITLQQTEIHYLTEKPVFVVPYGDINKTGLQYFTVLAFSHGPVFWALPIWWRFCFNVMSFHFMFVCSCSLPLIIFPAHAYYFKWWSQSSGSHTKPSHFTLIYLIASIYLMATSHVHMMYLIILIHIISTYLFILTEAFLLIAKTPATFLSYFVNHWD